MNPTQLVPIIYAALVAGVFHLGPETRRKALQKRIREDLNYYLVTEIVLIVLTVLASSVYGQRWLHWVTWAALVVTVYLALRRTDVLPRKPKE